MSDQPKNARPAIAAAISMLGLSLGVTGAHASATPPADSAAASDDRRMTGIKTQGDKTTTAEPTANFEKQKGDSVQIKSDQLKSQQWKAPDASSQIKSEQWKAPDASSSQFKSEAYKGEHIKN